MADDARPCLLTRLKQVQTSSLVKSGILLQVLGVLAFSPTLFSHNPLLMVACMPGGAGLVGLGWLLWLWAFLREL